jgi:hypothetical protein
MTSLALPYSQTKLTDLTKLSFREEGHVYTLGNVVIPSVTQVVDSFVNFGFVPRDVLERARVRGTLVHQMTARWDTNPWPSDHHLERETIAAGLMGYLDAWKAVKRDYVLDIQEVEQRVYHRKHRFAGTFDRTSYLFGKPELAVIDIKSGELMPEYAWQTAAYMAAANDGRSGNKVQRRFVIQLMDNGKYRVEEHKDAADWDAFLGALAVMNWRLKYGRR